MVRAALFLSLLVSLLALAGLWTMEDPQPWVTVPSAGVSEPPQAPSADARASTRVRGGRATP